MKKMLLIILVVLLIAALTIPCTADYSTPESLTNSTPQLYPRPYPHDTSESLWSILVRVMFVTLLLSIPSGIAAAVKKAKLKRAAKKEQGGSQRSFADAHSDQYQNNTPDTVYEERVGTSRPLIQQKDMRICPECGKTLPGDAVFCTYCGTALPKKCPNCGSTLIGNEKFCRKCGYKL